MLNILGSLANIGHVINARVCPKHSASRPLTSENGQARPMNVFSSVCYPADPSLPSPAHDAPQLLEVWLYAYLGQGTPGSWRITGLFQHRLPPCWWKHTPCNSPGTGLGHFFLLLCQTRFRAHICTVLCRFIMSFLFRRPLGFQSPGSNELGHLVKQGFFFNICL